MDMAIPIAADNPLPPPGLVETYIDADFYAHQVTTLLGDDPFFQNDRTARSAARHYEAHGIAAGFNPHPLFSTTYYRRTHVDVAENPFLHFLQFGLAEGRQAHPFVAGLRTLDDLCTAYEPEVPPVVFDCEFYLQNNPDTADHGVSALWHYLQYGCLERRAPHPLFSPEFYAGRSGSTAPDLLADYLVNGVVQGIDPHPLFDGAFAAAAGGFGGAREDVFQRFLSDPWSGERPHPLFDIAFYRAQAKDGFGSSRNPLVHYVTERAAWMIAPHPLFDPGHYLGQLSGLPEQPLLLHYLTQGWRLGLSPHPLFDPKSYGQATGFDPHKSSGSPLEAYAKSTSQPSPHYLLEPKIYLAQRGPIETPVLQDYLTRADRGTAAIHPMFDVDHYVTQVAAHSEQLHESYHGEAYHAMRRVFAEEEVRRDPLDHYLRYGWRAGLSPHGAFDPGYYREQAGPLEGDPLAHYLRDGGQAVHSPCLPFDLKTYLAARPECDPRKTIPYVDFLALEGERPETNQLLDNDAYMALHPDLRKAGVDPSRHYVDHGWSEDRTPNRFFSASHALDVDPESPLLGETAAGLFLKYRRLRPRILFVGHDASLSGAPLILHRLVENLGAVLDCELYTLLAHPGPLESEFRKVSHTWSVGLGFDMTFMADGAKHDAGWVDTLNAALDKIGLDRVVVAVCNTIQTRAYADILSARGIPVVSLVHEAADCFEAGQFLSMYRASRSVIFPSRYTADKALQLVGAQPARSMIRGQGLLTPFIGQGDRAAARAAVRTELGIPDGAMIVLGCGTVDWRKGVDLFARVAIKTLKTRPDTYFVWVGDSEPGYGTAKYWTEFDLSDAVRRNLRFVPPQDDMNPFYLAADLFLLTSRTDPFPCVVHEAMAAALPIVAFKGCSGGVEAFGDGGILIAPFDTHAMAKVVGGLLKDERKRRAMSERSVRRVRTEWNNEAYARDVLAEIEDVSGVTLPRRAPLRHPHGGPRVFLLQPDWGISGVNTFSEILVKGLREKGMDARFLFTRGRFTPFEKGHQPDLPATYLQPRCDRPDSFWNVLMDFLRKNRPCVVIPNYDYVVSGVSPITPEGVGFVGIAHSDDVEHYEHVYRLGLYWERIVAVSERVRQQIETLNPGFAPRLSRIRYGVPFDEASARATVEARFEAARAAGPAHPLRLVYTGRLVQHQKRIKDFIKLVDGLRAADVPFQLTLIGAGPEAGYMEHMLRHMRETGQVVMPGRLGREAIAEHLAQSDVFVLLSDFEGLPLSMLEAMAAGVTPVVRDMESGIPEVLDDGVSGHICARWGVEDMVRRLAELQRDPARLRAMNHGAIDAVIRHRLSAAQMVDDYAALIEDIFETMATSRLIKPVPHAHSAPHKGISVPPSFYPCFTSVGILDPEA